MTSFETIAHSSIRFSEAYLASQLPANLGDQKFDLVLLLKVAEHLNDAHLNSTLSEISRVIKRGGILVITTPNEENLPKSNKYCPECGAIFHEWRHVRSWSVRSLSGRLLDHGFSLITAKTLDFSTLDNSIFGVHRKLLRLACRNLKDDPGNPHMHAVYLRNL